MSNDTVKVNMTVLWCIRMHARRMLRSVVRKLFENKFEKTIRLFGFVNPTTCKVYHVRVGFTRHRSILF